MEIAGADDGTEISLVAFASLASCPAVLGASPLRQKLTHARAKLSLEL